MCKRLENKTDGSQALLLVMGRWDCIRSRATPTRRNVRQGCTARKVNTRSVYNDCTKTPVLDESVEQERGLAGRQRFRRKLERADVCEAGVTSDCAAGEHACKVLRGVRVHAKDDRSQDLVGCPDECCAGDGFDLARGTQLGLVISAVGVYDLFDDSNGYLLRDSVFAESAFALRETDEV